GNCAECCLVSDGRWIAALRESDRTDDAMGYLLRPESGLPDLSPAASSSRTPPSRPRASRRSRTSACPLCGGGAAGGGGGGGFVGSGAVGSGALARHGGNPSPAYSRPGGGIRPDHPTPPGRPPYGWKALFFDVLLTACPARPLPCI